MICGKVAAQSYGNYGALFRMSAIGDSLAATYYPPDVQGYEANNCVKLVQRDEHLTVPHFIDQFVMGNFL